jgi:hypothetical protein
VVRQRPDETVCIVFNLNWESSETFSLDLPTEQDQLTDLLSEESFDLVDGELEADFGPAACVISRL